MSTPAAPLSGLLRATLTLVAGGALAQALPLLLGPWLTRLYTPDDFGHYHLFAAVAANVAVVACARYEFALPLAQGDAEAEGLRRLCLRLLAAVSGLALLGALAWHLVGKAPAWVLWLGPAVAVAGGLSLATLWATRAQAFRALALGRVLQYGGGAVAQGAAGLAGGGVAGLVAGPVLASGAALALLRLPLRTAPGVQPEPATAVARRHRDFPLLNTPHAFAGALQDTVALALVTAWLGPVAAGFWGLSLRYLKAPATLVGGAVSQALYPKLAQAGASAAASAAAPGARRSWPVTAEARQAVRRVMAVLALMALPLVAGLWALGPWAFALLFGEAWRGAGELARALGLYIGLHFVAAPLAVVTLAWGAQAWALQLAVVGQLAFVAALAAGLALGGLAGAGWGVSLAMLAYFGYYFFSLATWPLDPPPVPAATASEPTA